MAEKKYLDQTWQGGVSGEVLPGWSFLPGINFPAQGVGNNQRIGKQIRLRSLRIHFKIECPTGTLAELFNAFRVIFFLWRDETSVGAGSVVENTAVSVQHIVPLNRQSLQSGLLVPIYDRTFYTTTNTRPYIFKKLNFYGKRLPKKLKTFIGAGTVPASYNILGLMCSDSIAAPHPIMNGYYRMTYVDC